VYYHSNTREAKTMFSLSPSKINGNRQEVDTKNNTERVCTLCTPDITKVWQRRMLHTEIFSREKDPRRVFVYLRLTLRQIEISICNLARGSDHPGIPPAANRATNRDWLVPDLLIWRRVAGLFFVALSFLPEYLGSFVQSV